MPHVRNSVRGPKTTGDPDFLPRAPPTSAYAAFIKESRMEFASANKVHRKSGGSPTIAFVPTLPRLNGLLRGGASDYLDEVVKP